MLDLARRIGLKPSRVAGHSYGELVALHAAGVLERDELLRLSLMRGQILSNLGPNSGAMTAVALSVQEVEPHLQLFPQVMIANINGPRQVVLSGPAPQLGGLIERLRKIRHSVHPLSVSAGFHSEMMRPARDDFARFLADWLQFRPPGIPVHGNLDGEPYPSDATAIRNRPMEHLERPANFVSQIEKMYEAGVRTFLELGPGHVLTGLVSRILAERPHVAIAVDGGLEKWLEALARLFVIGVPLTPASLFDGRMVRWMDFDRLPESDPDTANWMIDGGRVWKKGGQPQSNGRLPYIDRDSIHRRGAKTSETYGEIPSDEMMDAESLPPPSERPATGSKMISATSQSSIERTYQAYAETMRRFLEQQERVVSLVLQQAGMNQMPSESIRHTLSESSVALAVTSLASQIPDLERENQSREIVVAGSAPNRPELTRLLIKIVSRRTGYRAEELDLNQDLEAELGVDSIKRIEILSEIQESPPTHAVEWVPGQLDTLTRLKSLNSLVDSLVAGFESSPRWSPLSTGPDPAVNGGGSVETECPRYVMRGVKTALPGQQLDSFNGLYLVTEDDLDVAPLVVTALREHGATAFLLRHADLRSSERLDQRVMVLRHIHGPVCGVVHLTPLATGTADHDLVTWRQSTELVTKRFFRILQLCADDFKNASESPRILAVSRMGGDRGNSGNFSGTPASGGNHGLLRTMESEYPRVLCKHVDFDDTLTPEEISRHVVSELRTSGHHEIGFPHGTRMAYSVTSSPLKVGAGKRDWRPQNGWVVLATGAARGITAEVCRELAFPGVRLIVVGRGEMPSGEHVESESEIENLRRRLLDEARERRGQLEAKPTAADVQEIEVEIQKRLAERERWKNLEAFRKAGAEVEYHSIDVRSESQFGQLIDDIHDRFGRLDAVLHGAGIIEDQWLENKHAESFDRVYDTKVDSTFILSRHVRQESPKWCVLFSSVSGRFGNPGRADYASANEVLNRLACRMKVQWPSTRVVSINWGPWRDGGMANAATLGLLENRGIRSIAPASGRQFFCDELSYGDLDDVEVIAGDGPWRTDSDHRLGSAIALGIMVLQLRELQG
jgi:malonyl CoA-acyl carrier protein transacylase/NAD(P)-dependent dehydrogenase (short-subunit alcohol dehydrogenase family)